MNPAGGPDLIGIAVYGDPGAPETNIIHIEQSGLGLPDEAYYREDHYAPIREAYVDMVAKQLKNAKLAADDEQAEAQAQRFLDVETRIAANHWDNVATRDSVKTYNPTDYAELSGMLADYDLDTWIESCSPHMIRLPPLRCSRLISEAFSTMWWCMSPASSPVLTHSGRPRISTISSCGHACM